MALRIRGNVSNKHLDPIIKLQKRCFRTITLSNYLDSTIHIFPKLELIYLKKNYTSNTSNDVYTFSKYSSEIH